MEDKTLKTQTKREVIRRREVNERCNLHAKKYVTTANKLTQNTTQKKRIGISSHDSFCTGKFGC